VNDGAGEGAEREALKDGAGEGAGDERGALKDGVGVGEDRRTVTEEAGAERWVL